MSSELGSGTGGCIILFCESFVDHIIRSSTAMDPLSPGSRSLMFSSGDNNIALRADEVAWSVTCLLFAVCASA